MCPLDGVDLTKPLAFLDASIVLTATDVEHTEFEPQRLTETEWAFEDMDEGKYAASSIEYFRTCKAALNLTAVS